MDLIFIDNMVLEPMSLGGGVFFSYTNYPEEKINNPIFENSLLR